MARRAWLLAGVMAGAAALPLAGQQRTVTPLASFSEPATSPDRAEIAVVSGASESTVKRRWQTARLWLASELQAA